MRFTLDRNTKYTKNNKKEINKIIMIIIARVINKINNQHYESKHSEM